MKIYVDKEEILELKEFQKKVIQNDISSEIFEEDMKRRVKYILTHKYEQCFKRLKDSWMPKLQKRFSSIPTDDEKLAQLIFEQEDYENRSQRKKKE